MKYHTLEFSVMGLNERKHYKVAVWLLRLYLAKEIYHRGINVFLIVKWKWQGHICAWCISRYSPLACHRSQKSNS